MKQNFKALENFVKTFLTSPFMYETHCSDIKLLFKDIKKVTFSSKTYIDLDKLDSHYPLIYVLSGEFNIVFKNKTIEKVITDKPYLIGETSFLKLITYNKPVNRIANIYTNSEVEAYLLDLRNFFDYPLVLKEIIVENILLNLSEKIIYMNNRLEKLSTIYNSINDFFLNDNKENITDLINKIKKILSNSYKPLKKSKNNKNSFYINELQSYLSNKKEDIYKRFYFLKKYVLPKIHSLNDEKLIFFIAKEGKWAKFNKGEILCYQGEPNNSCIYIIIKGGVDIIVNNSKINNLEGTFLVGEMALIGNIKGNFPKRSATVKFNQESVVIIVKIDKFFKFSKQIKLKFSFTLIQQMLNRLYSTNESYLGHLYKILHFIENLEKSGEYPLVNIKILKDAIFSKYII